MLESKIQPDTAYTKQQVQLTYFTITIIYTLYKKKNEKSVVSKNENQQREGKFKRARELEEVLKAQFVHIVEFIFYCN